MCSVTHRQQHIPEKYEVLRSIFANTSYAWFLFMLSLRIDRRTDGHTAKLSRNAFYTNYCDCCMQRHVVIILLDGCEHHERWHHWHILTTVAPENSMESFLRIWTIHVTLHRLCSCIVLRVTYIECPVFQLVLLLLLLLDRIFWFLFLTCSFVFARFNKYCGFILPP